MIDWNKLLNALIAAVCAGLATWAGAAQVPGIATDSKLPMYAGVAAFATTLGGSFLPSPKKRKETKRTRSADPQPTKEEQ